LSRLGGSNDLLIIELFRRLYHELNLETLKLSIIN